MEWLTGDPLVEAEGLPACAAPSALASQTLAARPPALAHPPVESSRYLFRAVACLRPDFRTRRRPDFFLAAGFAVAAPFFPPPAT